MVSEILSTTDRIFCDFGQFFAHLFNKGEVFGGGITFYLPFTLIYQTNGNHATEPSKLILEWHWKSTFNFTKF